MSNKEVKNKERSKNNINMSNKEEGLELTGVVQESVRGGFIVKLDDGDHIISAHLGGKMRKNFIRVVPGDKVTVELSPYDLTKGRIIFRK